MTHLMSTIIASANPLKKFTTPALRSSDTFVSAAPKPMVNTMSGSIAPSAADLMGFAGTRSMNHCATPGAAGGAVAVAADCGLSPSAIDASMSRRVRIGAATIVAHTAADNARPRNTTRLRTPSRVSERSSPIETMPEMRLATTRGMTAIGWR